MKHWKKIINIIYTWVGSNVEILMEDRCTRKEAERLLKNSTVVYELKDFTEHFGQFMEDWQEDKEGIEAYKKMLETKKPMSGYSFVEYNGKEYLRKDA